MKTILITGSTGFLGSHIVEELVVQGYNIVALKRKNWERFPLSKKCTKKSVFLECPLAL